MGVGNTEGVVLLGMRLYVVGRWMCFTLMGAKGKRFGTTQSPLIGSLKTSGFHISYHRSLAQGGRGRCVMFYYEEKSRIGELEIWIDGVGWVGEWWGLCMLRFEIGRT